VAAADQKIEQPNRDELEWIADNLAIGKKIVAVYADGSELDLDSLDRAVVAWASRKESDRVEANDLVNALGIAFGHIVGEALGLKWAVVSDENGVDIALHGSPGNILVFPTASIAKRIARADVPLFRHLYERLSEDIQRLREDVH